MKRTRKTPKAQPETFAHSRATWSNEALELAWKLGWNRQLCSEFEGHLVMSGTLAGPLRITTQTVREYLERRGY